MKGKAFLASSTTCSWGFAFTEAEARVQIRFPGLPTLLHKLLQSVKDSHTEGNLWMSKPFPRPKPPQIGI